MMKESFEESQATRLLALHVNFVVMQRYVWNL
jgi:hypothetical protein